MKKKLFSLVLAFALCMGLCAPAFAADSEFIIEDGVLVEYTGSGGTVNIPAGVTEIGEGAFTQVTGRSFVTSVTIPEGCVKIADEAFYFLGDLVSSVKITLPSTLKEIGNNAFECAHITQINFPQGLESIGDEAFVQTLVTRVDLPSSLRTLGRQAFSNCTNLAQVSWPGHTFTAKELEQWFFDTPFYYVGGSGETTDPDPGPGTDPNPGPVTPSSDFVIENGVLVEYTGSAAKVTVPDGVTAIGWRAFSERAFLRQVVLPAGVTRIEEQAFQRCYSLSQVTLPEGLRYIGPQAFGNCTVLKNVNIPSSLVEIDDHAFANSGLTGAIRLPNGMKKLGGGAFGGTAITSLTMPDGMEHIGDGIFYGCESLTSITFPASGPAVQELKSTTAHQFYSYISNTPSLREVKNIPSTEYAAAVAGNQASISNLGNPQNYLASRSDAVTAKAKEITAGLSRDYDKASAINQWVAKNITYDYAYFQGDTNTTGTTADEVLAGKKAVCTGYANLTRALLQASGIPAISIHGRTGNDAHAWNAAYVDGRWIFLDSTWSRPGQGSIYDARYFDPTVFFLSQTHQMDKTYTTPGQEMPEPDRKLPDQPDPGKTETPVELNIKFTDVKPGDYYANAVKWAVDNKITSGTSATTFSPDATCTTSEILTFLWRANGSPEPAVANPFINIYTSAFYYKPVLWALEKGMIPSDTTFGWGNSCTRAMAVEFIWKAAGSPTASYDGRFTDVYTGSRYAQAVAWAVENNITVGTSKTTFSPDSTCTRGQIVTLLHRAMA